MALYYYILILDHDFEEANMYVKANALGVETSFPMPDPSVCKHLEDNACPLVEGDVATYKLSFHIFALLPTVRRLFVVLQLYLIHPYRFFRFPSLSK